MPDPQGSLPTSVTDPSGASIYGRPVQLPDVQVTARRPDNPEDMFTPQQNFARNQAWAHPGPYVTQLPPRDESQFQQWVKSNNVNWNNADQSYDMRGFWKAQQAGDPNAVATPVPEDINPKTGEPNLHYPDKWKTPYEATFSAESMYAKPNAPRWIQIGKDHWQYRMPGGHVIFDDNEKRWYGVPSSGADGIWSLLRGAGNAIASDIVDLAHAIPVAGAKADKE